MVLNTLIIIYIIPYKKSMGKFDVVNILNGNNSFTIRRKNIK